MPDAKYYQANKERLAEYGKRWRAANKDQDRNWRLAKNYNGFTPEQYQTMLQEQFGRCKICGTDKPGGVSKGHLHIDHSHETGLVRGLLCNNCNTGLGRFGDNIKLLAEAIAYLQNHEKEAPCLI
jgi:hypothetical protein